MSKTTSSPPPSSIVLEEHRESIEVRTDGLYRVTTKVDYRPTLAPKKPTPPVEEDKSAPKPVESRKTEWLSSLPEDLKSLLNTPKS